MDSLRKEFQEKNLGKTFSDIYEMESVYRDFLEQKCVQLEGENDRLLKLLNAKSGKDE